jgi:large subunit ribosomal protein L35
MPKMKTHSGSKKRFKLTATGKVQGRHAYSSHILEKKSPKRKRSFSQDRTLSKPDAKRATRLLGGYGK